MKFRFVPLILSTLAVFGTHAGAQTNWTINDYNNSLPFWGTSWLAGSNSVNGYYPSFYTGFAARSEFPERIHVRLSRGNQTRLSVILDDQTINDYLFDLVKRDEWYGRVTDTGGRSLVNISTERGARMMPQLNDYRQILDSSAYGIRQFVQQARVSSLSPEATYAKSLTVLKQLNPGRVFQLHLDLRSELMRWKTQMKSSLGEKGQTAESYFTSQPAQAIVALNSLVWGRINLTQKPSREVLTALVHAADLATRDGDDDTFVAAARDLFKVVTGTKYQFRVLDDKGQWESPLQCSDLRRCFLSYPEFTAIYPTGSVEATTSDSFGNKINTFATPGLWQFLSRGSSHDVDNIRNEPYYAWIPKMDYEAAGNGFHNPGVRFYGVKASLKTALGIPTEHKTFEAVKRGGVSHGCSRLAMGHIWEMRHVFPVENSKMTQVFYFGNKPQDFDLYDINGDGKLEVMGVEYLISYGVQGTGGDARREGTDLTVNPESKLRFYQDLYGEKQVFRVDGDRYIFMNPSVSLPSYMDFKKKTSAARLTLNGEYPLYEQAYEKDKVQFYVPFTTKDLMSAGNSFLSKRIVRLMGRARGCAPFSDKSACGESAFDKEAASILNEVGR